ncbi:MAG: universal stress protein [Bryobacteraceae bacterium]
MMKRVLFPVDFSPRCADVSRAVRALSAHHAAELTLVHVTPEGSPEKQAAFEKLSTFGGSFEGIIRRLVMEGPVAASIVDYARTWPADLIIMPTHGQTRFRQLLLGSVTASVLHDAECPVWTTAHQPGGGPLPEAYRSVVCAIDMGPLSAGVLRAAKAFAASWGATLHVIHAVPAIDPRLHSAPADRAHQFLVQTARMDYPALAAEAGVDSVLEIMEEPSLVDCVAAACRKHSADLLVIGRGAIQGVMGRLRTNAHEIIRNSPCPVLSI